MKCIKLYEKYTEYLNELLLIIENRGDFDDVWINEIRETYQLYNEYGTAWEFIHRLFNDSELNCETKKMVDFLNANLRDHVIRRRN